MTHLKSLAAPKHFPKKDTVFTVSPRPGPHPKKRSIPLLIAVRHLLSYAENAKTARKLIRSGKFFVDGKPVRDPRYPLGLMDVLSIPTTGEHYRILIRPGKGLFLFKIAEPEANFKVCQVLRKNHVRGGGLMIGLHDGRTILFRAEELERGRALKILDSVKIGLPDQDLLETVSLNTDVQAYVHSGARAGLYGKVAKIRREVVFPDKPTVTIETTSGTVTTLLRNVMPIGGETPWITLP
ncbi:MAG: S4 domain-containing protein [Candidatus Caldarchaeum sp.]|uniref:Small ribosomal subunit protein eS4 n=1 Tax=Caldiarchaeum subterraneum TaxID=311458 RepID=A0A7C5Y4H3_CALS0